MELAPASPCSYRRVVNRKRFRTQSTANRTAKGTAQTHHGRRPGSDRVSGDRVSAVPWSGSVPTVMTSDGSCLDGRVDPGDDLVQHLVEAGGGLEPQPLLGLLGGGHPALDVVLERLVVDQPQRDAL